VTLFDLARLVGVASKQELQMSGIQNRRQKVFNRGLYVCAGRLYVFAGGLTFKFDKNSSDLHCFMFQFGGGLELCFGVLSPAKPSLWRLDCWDLLKSCKRLETHSEIRTKP